MTSQHGVALECKSVVFSFIAWQEVLKETCSLVVQAGLPPTEASKAAIGTAGRGAKAGEARPGKGGHPRGEGTRATRPAQRTACRGNGHPAHTHMTGIRR